jgi:hypothetical protein
MIPAVRNDVQYGHAVLVFGLESMCRVRDDDFGNVVKTDRRAIGPVVRSAELADRMRGLSFSAHNFGPFKVIGFGLVQARDTSTVGSRRLAYGT